MRTFARCFRRFARAAALLMMVFQAGGCTLVGAGVGALVPRYEAVQPSQSTAVAQGTDVSVVRRTGRTQEIGPPRYRREIPETEELRGTYSGTDGKKVWVTTERGLVGSNAADVERIRVRDGTHAGTGALVGGCIDVALLIAYVGLRIAIGPSTSGHAH